MPPARLMPEGPQAGTGKAFAVPKVGVHQHACMLSGMSRKTLLRPFPQGEGVKLGDLDIGEWNVE